MQETHENYQLNKLKLSIYVNILVDFKVIHYVHYIYKIVLEYVVYFVTQ